MSLAVSLPTTLAGFARYSRDRSFVVLGENRGFGTVHSLGGSCRFGKGRVCIGDPVKSMPEPGTERAVVDCATDLEQKAYPVDSGSYYI